MVDPFPLQNKNKVKLPDGEFGKRQKLEYEVGSGEIDDVSAGGRGGAYRKWGQLWPLYLLHKNWQAVVHIQR